MRWQAAVLICALIFAVPMARADTVRLKSGIGIEGDVTLLSDRVMIENEDGTAFIAASQVEGIVKTSPAEVGPDVTSVQAREDVTAEPPQEAQDGADADGDDALGQVTPGVPRIGTVSTGTRIGVRPIVGPRRRYVYLELRARRTHAPIWRTFTFQTGRTTIQVRR